MIFFGGVFEHESKNVIFFLHQEGGFPPFFSLSLSLISNPLDVWIDVEND